MFACSHLRVPHMSPARCAGSRRLQRRVLAGTKITGQMQAGLVLSVELTWTYRGLRLQGDLAVPSFLVLGGIWQQVQHCPSLQP